jgi:hypothetical protein
MNGRVQDPVLGRFLSPDPLVQAPYDSRSLNRYSYVWNNPMTLVDPSGFQTDDPYQDPRNRCYWVECEPDPCWNYSGRGECMTLDEYREREQQERGGGAGGGGGGGSPCPLACHADGIVAPVITPELLEHSRHFYSNLGEDYIPLSGAYHLVTGEYYFTGDPASRFWGAVATVPYVGVGGKLLSNSLKNMGRSARFAAEAGSRAEARPLHELAEEISNAGHPVASRMRTIAVGEDSAGNLYVGSSNGLDRGMQEAAKSLNVSRVPDRPGLHAEEELLQAVPDLRRVGTFRRTPCGGAEHDCTQQLLDRGVEVTNP